MTTNWLNTFHNAKKEALRQVERLEELQFAAEVLGLEILADSIGRVRNAIRTSVGDMSDAVTSSVHQQFAQTQEASMNMVKAALAGATLSKEVYDEEDL